MNSKVFVAALSGLGAGMVIGMLFAPEKGTVVRQRISEKASGLSDQLKSTVKGGIDKISELGATARESFDNLSAQVENQ
ncbi:MAG: YtxH domain-containing protein [Chitinophagaceae bacterium]|nr:YtxH domain-containing protein [Chitinophagaceae bacterium]